MQTILKLLWGYSQIIGGIYPPPGFGTPDYDSLLMFWKLHFTVLSNFKIKLSSNAVTKLRSENF